MKQLVGLLTLALAQGGRYWDSLFAWRIDTVAYGQALSLWGTPQTLYANLFLPEADTEPARPVVVFLFGGAYISGSRGDSDITHLARYFAARGYVTATIDYRTGLSGPTATDWINGSLRAMHDLKAFIRFLKKSVLQEGNPFHIDTNRIYVGGSSAGACTALHAAFLTSAAELAQVPQADTAYLASQGGIEGNSGHPGYSSRFYGVFSLSGAILKTDWIDSSKVPAVIAMHGTGDNVAPYKKGPFPFIYLEAEGGYNIDSVAAERGLYHALFTWVGAGHVPYGTQNSINPPYMADVENFLRYHFYQWNSRATSSLNAPTFLSPDSPVEVWSIDGRRIGAYAIENLPSGVWLLRFPDGHTRKVYRP